MQYCAGCNAYAIDDNVNSVYVCCYTAIGNRIIEVQENTMSFLIYIAIAVVFFGIGWFVGVRNLSNIEELTDNLGKAAKYVENLESPDVDEMNRFLNINRDTDASFHIRILQHIEDSNLDSAKEISMNLLTSYYDDINEDALHEMSSDESKEIVKKIEKLAQTYPVFRKIMDSSEVE